METRRLIFLVVFLFSSFTLYESWRLANTGKPVTQSAGASSPSGTLTNSPATNSSNSAAGIPTASTALNSQQPSPTVNSNAPLAASSQISTAMPTASPLVITTDVVKFEISPQGASIENLAILRQKNLQGDAPFVLLDPKHQYQAQSGLIGADNLKLPNHRSYFQLVDANAPMTLAAGQDQLNIRLYAEFNGGRVIKTFTIDRSSYLIKQSWEIENKSAAAITAQAYYQFQRDQQASEGSHFFMPTFTGPAIFTNQEKYQKLDFADIVKNKQKHAKLAEDGWLAMVQHYFVAAWLSEGKVKREFYTRAVDINNQSLINAGVILPINEIKAGEKVQSSMNLYAGPQIQKVLKQLAPDFDAVVDYGWLAMLASPMFTFLDFLHSLVGNWGWAIILLTLSVKALFYPLSAASYKSMAKMKAVTPRMMQLRERYSDDRMRLNQEMMKLYQSEKINPLGGCLPILIQIPVFIALYWVVLGAVEMRGAPWMLWISDLSATDPYYILPIVMVASMYFQMKLNPTPPDPLQAKMMMVMPFVFGITFFWFPAALVLYWVVNNILSIAQQWQITRMIEGKSPSELKKIN